jgi:hypothetical protein
MQLKERLHTTELTVTALKDKLAVEEEKVGCFTKSTTPHRTMLALFCIST